MTQDEYDAKMALLRKKVIECEMKSARWLMKANDITEVSITALIMKARKDGLKEVL